MQTFGYAFAITVELALVALFVGLLAYGFIQGMKRDG